MNTVTDAVNAINSAIDIIAKMVLDERTYPDVVEEQEGLWKARGNLSYILTYIKGKENPQ
jgi:hypothetical protein